MRSRRWAALVVGLALLAAPARAQDDVAKDAARKHFDAGLSHFDKSEWSAALAEFVLSRQLYPTRAATKNAAICLRNERRYDEALEMFQALMRLPDLPAADQELANREIESLLSKVGLLELRGAAAGATIVVDARERGTFPPAAPIRVTTGTHTVRVSKEGYEPFERQFEVASGQTAHLDAKMNALKQAGRLRVTEGGKQPLDVVVDNAVVGKTPWEGSLAVGQHTVLLRGEGNVGTEPASVTVRTEELAQLSLRAEPLEGELRVDPTPRGASVAIDGVLVGRGGWEGKLRTGPHKIEVGAEGFLAQSREVRLERGNRQNLALSLERDAASPLWGTRRPSHFTIEVDGSFAAAALFGGDIAGACTGSCSSGLPIGFHGLFRGGYELGSGLGFSIDGGYFSVGGTVEGRSTVVRPVGVAPNAGVASDELRLKGVMIGAAASYHRGESIPLMFRLGAGGLLGTLSDARSGTFTNVAESLAYGVSVRESPSATYLYFAPEARVGVRMGHFEISGGVALFVLVALKQPTWQDQTFVSTTPNPPPARGDGIGTFGSQALAGRILLVPAPGLGARYEF